MLGNLDIIEPYRAIHMSIVATNYPRASPNQIQCLHNETFHEWFKKYVEYLRQKSTQSISKEIKILAAGPNQWARSYKLVLSMDSVLGPRPMIQAKQHKIVGLSVKQAR